MDTALNDLNPIGMAGSTTLGLAAALASSFTWSVGVSVYSVLAPRYPAALIHATRAWIALPFFMVLFFLESGSWSQAWLTLAQAPAEAWGWAAISILCSYTVGDTLYLSAAKRLGPSAALAIASTFPLGSAMEGALFRGQVLSQQQWFGFCGVLVGTLIVILSKRERPSRRTGHKMTTSNSEVKVKGSQGSPWSALPLSGLIFAIATAFFWALNTIAVSRGSQIHPGHQSNLLRMIIAFLVCTTWSWLTAGKHRTLTARSKALPLPPSGALILPPSDFKRYGLAFACEVCLGSFLFAYGLSHAPLGLAAALSALAPVITVPIGLALKTERPDPMGIFGVILVVVSTILLIL